MRRNPLTSMLDFAAERNREAASLGSVISQIAKPALSGMGVQTDEMTPQPAVMRGPVPTAQPLGPMTGPAMAPTPVMSKEELKANVFPGESGGDYNALFGYSNRPGGKFEGVKLTDMTVNEVAEFTDPKGPYGQWVKDQIGYVATPTGAFQTVGTTLKDAMRGLGLTGDEPYDQNTQDAIGMWIYENQGPEAWEGWNKGNTVASGAGSTSVSGGAGADTLGTGNNVEDILAQLYPQMSPEDERKQNRKDFFAAASQGLSALSQGRPQDFSNIRQAKEQRRTQAVQDMRERERARAAATLVLDQGGSPAMATALATGAASMGDFMTDRQIARAEKEADRQKLLAATRMDLLAPTLVELGIPEDRIAEIVAYGKEGGDVTEILTQTQAVAAAEKLREQEADQDELIATYETSDNPVQQEIARLVRGGLPIKEAADVANKLFPQAGGKEFADIARAQAIVDAGVINPTDGKPFSTPGAVLGFEMLQKQATGAGPQATVTWNPDGSMTITPPAPATAAPAGTTAPAGAVAPAVGAPVVGAPAGVAGAFNQRFGGMETGIPAGAPAPAVAAQTLPLDVALDVADLQDKIAETAQREQELAEAVANAPDNATKLRLEGERIAAQTKLDELNLQQQIAAEPDVAKQRQLQNELTELQIQNEADKAAATEAKAALRKEQQEIRGDDTLRLLADVYKTSLGFMENPIASAFRGFVADYFPASEAGKAQGQLKGVKVGIFTEQLAGMRESSTTGAAVGNVTDSEREAFGDAYGALLVSGSPELLRQNLRAVANAGLDLRYGTQTALKAAVESGKLDAATAERYGARYDIDGTADTGMVGELGPVTPLGIAAVDETVLSMETAPVEELVSPDSPDAEYEAMLLDNPALIYAVTPEDYAKLSPAQKEVFDRLLEGPPQ
jgi:hypothetical protein